MVMPSLKDVVVAVVILLTTLGYVYLAEKKRKQSARKSKEEK